MGMKGYKVYTKIQQLKEQGFKRNAAAKMLNIHRNTVNRYWNMTTDEYDKSLYKINRKKQLDEYGDIITHWLSEYPTLSSAQVCDWLKEHYSASFTERTVGRYVQELRKIYGLKKCVRQRDYEAVSELPQGQQIQVYFGEKWMQSIDGGRVKVRFCAFVLSHSRYKYVEFLDRPYTSVDL
jgi:transposase